ncbi:MAG: RsmB/NOP family class I SAM-dependent RNA methyltransferase [Candidatus Woesearchaeota archaeon]
MAEPKWKEKFIERYSKLTDIDIFLETSLKPLPKTIRVNTLKATVEEMKQRMKLTPIPWCKEGFTTEGFALGNTMDHFLGYFYMQSAASMIPPVVLDPGPQEIVLDMCASPGSKTSQMAAMMNNQGIIVANDNAIKRLKPLTLNLQRMGVSNTVITLMDGKRISGQKFDKILVDAPCSGIGTIRKSFKTIEMWNPNYSKKLHYLQKKLLSTAISLLKEDGVVVYSTCTLEPDEDEGVIDAILSSHEDVRVEKIELPIRKGEAVTEFEGKSYSDEVRKCLRIWPQDNDTEGFFVAKLKKA